MKAIDESYKELTVKYASVTSLIETIKKEDKLEDDDRSPEFLGSFADTARLAVLTTEDKVKSIEGKYETTVKLFGETPKELPMESFIEIFNKFNKDLNVSNKLGEFYSFLKKFVRRRK